MEFDDLEKVYIENARLVYKYLISLTNSADVAEEITQETFFQASRTISQFRGGECKVSVWLCQIAKHIWYDYLRKKDCESVDLDSCRYLVSVHDVASEIDEKDRRTRLYNDIHLLEPRMREVVHWRLSDFSFKEIGEIVGESENWARVNFHRAKQKMYESMKE